MSKPDYECGDHDANVVDCVAENVDQDTQDAEVHAVLRKGKREMEMFRMMVVWRDFVVRGARCEALDVAVYVARVIVAVAVSVAVAVVMLMEECSADEVQNETDAAYYEYQFRVVDMLKRNEALDRLQCNAQTQR